MNLPYMNSINQFKKKIYDLRNIIYAKKILIRLLIVFFFYKYCRSNWPSNRFRLYMFYYWISRHKIFSGLLIFIYNTQCSFFLKSYLNSP